MKVFFHSSIFAKDQYLKNYSTIVDICLKNKCTVFSDHMLKRSHHDTDMFTIEEHQNDFQRLTNQIKESDAIIVEGSSPSIGTGHYMTIALNYLKPVFVLYTGEPHGVLVGDPNRLLFLSRYSIDNVPELELKIKNFLSIAKRKSLRNRFNLMIDDDTVDYLDRTAKAKRISKADVIRRLITENIKQSNDTQFK